MVVRALKSAVNLSLCSVKHKINQGFTLAICLIVALQPMMVELANAQEIIIDPTGNVGVRPGLKPGTAAPVVDIAKPNAGGVSLNKFTKFNVTNGGLVLNNSATGSMTTVAGAITGNANLTAGGASTIVNEVTSTNATTLRGTVEVAGQKAGVIIANPNGVACLGCNFINAGDATLTTGVPVIEGGTVALNVTQGSVTIGRGGLNGDTLANVNLIGRTVVIDGRVTAIDGINVQGGAQRYDLTGQRSVATLVGAGIAPDLVIDGTEFGAMEAGRIQIIGNEAGLGVRSLGALQSRSAGVTVASKGAASVRSIAATGKAEIRADGGDVVIGRDITSTTAGVVIVSANDVLLNDRAGLYGRTGVTVTGGGKLTFRGVVQSAAAVTLTAGTQLGFAAYGSAGTSFSLTAANGVDIHDATLVAQRVIARSTTGDFLLDKSALFAGSDVTVTAGNFALGQDVVVDGLTATGLVAFNVAASGNFRNAADLRRYDSTAFLYGGNLYNDATGVILNSGVTVTGDVFNAGLMLGKQSLTLVAGALYNGKTGTIAADALTISVAGVFENKGQITANGAATLSAAQRFANEGMIQAIRLSVTAPLIATGGASETRARDGLTLTAVSGSIATSGLVSSEAALALVASGITNLGWLVAGTSLTATATAAIRNDGSINGATAVSLNAAGAITNTGDIASYAGMLIASGVQVENAGAIIADSTLTITGPRLRNTGSAALIKALTGQLTSSTIYNSGRVLLVSDFARTTGLERFENAGLFATQGNLTLTGTALTGVFWQGASGTLISGLRAGGGDQQLITGKSLALNFASMAMTGEVFAGGNISVTKADALTIGGKLAAGQSIILTADSISIGAAARLQAVGYGAFRTAGTVRNDGQLAFGSFLSVGGGLTGWTNTGTIQADYTAGFSALAAFSNSGSFITTNGLSITAYSLANSGLMQAGTGLALFARRQIGTDPLTAAALYEQGTLDSTGTLNAAQTLTLVGGTVSTGAAGYITAARMNVAADRFVNAANAVLDGSVVNYWTVSGAFLQTGQVYASGDLAIRADSANLTARGMIASGANVSIASVGDTTLGGMMSANQITVTGATVGVASTGSVMTTADLRLTATVGRLLTMGELASGDDLVLAGVTLDLRGKIYGDRVAIAGQTSGVSHGEVYGAQTTTVTISGGRFTNYGTLEGRDALKVNATDIAFGGASEVSSTAVELTASSGITNYGKIFGARSSLLTAGTIVSNTTTGSIRGLTTTITGAALYNAGAIEVYGLYGVLDDLIQNSGTMKAETVASLRAARLINLAAGQITSAGSLFITTTGQQRNDLGGTIKGQSVELAAGSIWNAGAITAVGNLNAIITTGGLGNTTTGVMAGHSIFVDADGSISNAGLIKTVAPAGIAMVVTAPNLAPTGTVSLRSAAGLGNSGDIFGAAIRLEAATALTSAAGAQILASGTAFLKAGTSLAQQGVLRGTDLQLVAGQTIYHDGDSRATDSAFLDAATITNREVATVRGYIKANELALRAVGGISNYGTLHGVNSLSLLSATGNITNTDIGRLYGGAIAVTATLGNVTMNADVSAGTQLFLQGAALYINEDLRATETISLKSTVGHVNVAKTVGAQKVLVDAASLIRANAGSFRGHLRTQLVADDIGRLDPAQVSAISTVSTSANATTSYSATTISTDSKLEVVGGALTDLYIQLRTGSFGVAGTDLQTAVATSVATGAVLAGGDTDWHIYERAAITATGDVSLMASAGDMLLTGAIRAGGNLYLYAQDRTALRGITLAAAGTAADTGNGTGILHIEGRGNVLRYGGVTLTPANQLEVATTYSDIRASTWLTSQDLTVNVMLEGRDVIVDRSLQNPAHSISLGATRDILQTNEVVTARGITYQAGRNLRIDFNPFEWRAENPNAVSTAAFWDVETLGKSGYTLAAGAGGMSLFAGQDVVLTSGKIYSWQALEITAGNNIISQPFYNDNNLNDRPGFVGWLFDPLYTGVVAGHDASLVSLYELRAYENQLRARGNLTLRAGNSVSLIGSQLKSDTGDITIEALTGGVTMIAAPGQWLYDYTKVTTWHSGLFGMVKNTNVYEYVGLRDLYKNTDLSAANGDITIKSTGTNGIYASILTAGTEFAAQNILLETPNGNITAGTYRQRNETEISSTTTKKLFGFIKVGSSSSTAINASLINYGNDFAADENLALKAPLGTISITGGTLKGRVVSLIAARVEILAAINSERVEYNSRRENLITITTITSGRIRETADLPQITTNMPLVLKPGGQAMIGAAAGTDLNSQLINLVGTRQFSTETLGLVRPTQLAGANSTAAAVNQAYMFTYNLPGASTGAQFAYVDQLLTQYGATYNSFQLRDQQWYDKQVQLTPAFRALLTVVVSYATAGFATGVLGLTEGTLLAMGAQAATNSLIVGVIDGTITGTIDMGDILRGALLAGVSSAIGGYLANNINLGGYTDISPNVTTLQDLVTPAAIIDRLGDRVITQVVSNVVYGQNPLAGFDNLGRSFLVTEVMAISQFGIGELGNGSNTPWEGSFAHLMLHGGVGCLAMAAMQGNCTAGFFSGAGQSLLAGSGLPDADKIRLAPLLGAALGFMFANGNATNVDFGATVAQSGMFNNYLTHAQRTEVESLLDRLADARLACVASFNTDCPDIGAIVARLDQLKRISTANTLNMVAVCTAGQSAQCADMLWEATAFNEWASGWFNGERYDYATGGDALFAGDWTWLADLDSRAVDILQRVQRGEINGTEANIALIEDLAAFDGSIKVVSGVIQVGGVAICTVASAGTCAVAIAGAVLGANTLVEGATEFATGQSQLSVIELGLIAGGMSAASAAEVLGWVETGVAVVTIVNGAAVIVKSGRVVGAVSNFETTANLQASLTNVDFNIIRGQIATPAQIAALTSGPTGALGERVASAMLVRNGYTIEIAVQNASGNGIDIVARASNGQLAFFEVKTTAAGTIGNLSSLQQNSQQYITTLMQQAANGTIRGQVIAPEVQALATNFLQSPAALLPIPSTAIGVRLSTQEMFISPW